MQFIWSEYARQIVQHEALNVANECEFSWVSLPPILSLTLSLSILVNTCLCEEYLLEKSVRNIMFIIKWKSVHEFMWRVYKIVIECNSTEVQLCFHSHFIGIYCFVKASSEIYGNRFIVVNTQWTSIIQMRRLHEITHANHFRNHLRCLSFSWKVTKFSPWIVWIGAHWLASWTFDRNNNLSPRR